MPGVPFDWRQSRVGLEEIPEESGTQVDLVVGKARHDRGHSLLHQRQIDWLSQCQADPEQAADASAQYCGIYFPGVVQSVPVFIVLARVGKLLQQFEGSQGWPASGSGRWCSALVRNSQFSCAGLPISCSGMEGSSA
jgi:hypothetical protein